MYSIKICGNRNQKDVDTAVSAGADAVGFIVQVRHRSRDAIEVAAAAELLQHVPAHVTPVLVTHLVRPNELVELHAKVPAPVLQLHDRIGAAELAELRAALPSVLLVAAIGVTGPGAVENAVAVAGAVDALLLDTHSDDMIGGTGLIHDWSISARIRAAVPAPVVLAGGLTADNVASAIASVAPHAVDVNSGVDAPDGSKSASRCLAFVRAARAALTPIG